MAGYFLIFCCLSRIKSGQNNVLYGVTSAQPRTMHQSSAGKETIRKPSFYYTVINWIIIYYTVYAVSCRSVLERAA